MRKGNGKSVVKVRATSRGTGKAGNGGARESWNDQVAHLIHHDGLSREKARDHVILGELRSGHADALAALLIEGHVPSPNVRFALALMLLDNDEAEAEMDRHHADPASLWLPHSLVIKPRPAQPRHVRGAAGEANSGSKSAPVMHELGYEAAIARLDQAVLATDPGPVPTKSVPRPPAHSKRRK